MCGRINREPFGPGHSRFGKLFIINWISWADILQAYVDCLLSRCECLKIVSFKELVLALKFVA